MGWTERQIHNYSVDVSRFLNAHPVISGPSFRLGQFVTQPTGFHSYASSGRQGRPKVKFNYGFLIQNYNEELLGYSISCELYTRVAICCVFVVVHASKFSLVLSGFSHWKLGNFSEPVKNPEKCRYILNMDAQISVSITTKMKKFLPRFQGSFWVWAQPVREDVTL